jgi:hypothetical protein
MCFPIFAIMALLLYLVNIEVHIIQLWNCMFLISIFPIGTQTLGEEYCDIAQINVLSQTYPGLLVRSRK